MPITIKRSLNLAANVLSSGIDRRQGPHHVAQKSTMTNFPLRSGSSVSHFCTTIVGTGWFRNELAWIGCGGISSAPDVDSGDGASSNSAARTGAATGLASRTALL